MNSMAKFTVSYNDNEIEYQGVSFFVNISDRANGNITLEIAGGYAEDEDGEYMEIDSNFTIRELYEDASFVEDYDQEFEIEITDEDVKVAKEYRAAYPENVGAEF